MAGRSNRNWFSGGGGVGITSGPGIANNVAFWSSATSIAPQDSGGGTINWSSNILTITKGGAAQTISCSGGLILGGSGNARMAIATSFSFGTFASGNAYMLLGTGGILSYNAVGTVGSGVAPIYAKLDFTAQSASIASTLLYTTPNLASPSGEGQYEINWSAIVTTAATTSSTLGGAGGFQVIFTDLDTGVSTTPLAVPNASGAGNTVGTQLSGSVIVNAKRNTAINIQFGYTSSGATAMQFALHVKCIYLG